MCLIARLLKWVQLPWSKVKVAIEPDTIYTLFSSQDTNFHDALTDASSCFEHGLGFFRFDCCQICRTGGEVVGVIGASKKWRRCSILASTYRQRPVLFVHACVCVCVAFLSANLRGTGVHIEKRHTGELHASDQKNKRRREKKWDSPPVTGTTTWRTEAAKIPETKKKKTSDQTCLKSWKHPVWLVHVSHGITEFWCHPVGHFEGIFFPLPSQNNLNNFSAAYFNFQSIFDVLFVWLCLPECKKRKKKKSQCAPTVNHSWHIFPVRGWDLF